MASKKCEKWQYARQVRNSLPDHKPSKLAQTTEAYERDMGATGQNGTTLAKVKVIPAGSWNHQIYLKLQ